MCSWMFDTLLLPLVVEGREFDFMMMMSLVWRRIESVRKSLTQRNLTVFFNFPHCNTPVVLSSSDRESWYWFKMKRMTICFFGVRDLIEFSRQNFSAWKNFINFLFSTGYTCKKKTSNNPAMLHVLMLKFNHTYEFFHLRRAWNENFFRRVWESFYLFFSSHASLP